MLHIPTDILREVLNHLAWGDNLHLNPRQSREVTFSSGRDAWNLSRVDRRALPIMFQTGAMTFGNVMAFQLFVELWPHATRLVTTVEFELQAPIMSGIRKPSIYDMLLATKRHLPDVTKVIISCTESERRDNFKSSVWDQLRLPKVEYLEFVLSEDYSYRDMITLIRSFPNIKTLDMCDDVSKEGMFHASVSLPQLTKLISRTREREDDEEEDSDDEDWTGVPPQTHTWMLYGIFRDREQAQYVETLSLDRMNVLYDSHIGYFFRANVRHLEARTSDWEGWWDGQRKEFLYDTLARFERLETIDLIRVPLHQRSLPMQFKALPASVRSISLSAATFELVRLGALFRLRKSSALALVTLLVVDSHGNPLSKEHAVESVKAFRVALEARKIQLRLFNGWPIYT